jgi:hypothetical protein
MNALRAEWLADFPLGVQDLGRMGQSNIGMYRARFRQDEIRTSAGAYSSWARLDNLAREAALKGVTLTPVLINMPGESYSPPRTDAERQDFAAFAAAAARRYGPSGSFWASCDCPSRPVRVWELWNEANMAPYWTNPSAAEYGALLKAVQPELRQVDPSARVMFGGLAYGSSYDGTTRVEPGAFLRATIQSAGSQSFDALALHTYHGGDASRGVNAIGATVQTLKTYGGTKADGSPRHQVWVNEFGRATSVDNPATATDERAASEESQRAYVQSFLDLLLAQRAAWNLGPVFAYALRDSHAATESWHRLGLRRTNSDDSDAGAKPAWDVYATRSSGAGLLELPDPQGTSAPAANVLPAYGMGALKAEWLAGGPTSPDPAGLVDLDLIGQADAGLYRARFRQDRATGPDGRFTEWRQLDNLVGQAASRGVSIMPILINMPNEIVAPPRTASARKKFADFAAAAVRRYGPNGSFWPGCRCSPRPIRVWEIWAEPNEAQFWGTPSPAEYASLLKAVKPKVRTADPTARILHGALSYIPGSSRDMDANQFLRQVISSATWRAFDAVPVEAYTPDNSATPATYVNTLIKQTVDTLKAHGGTSGGAPRHQVWLAKVGTPTKPDDPATPADEAADTAAAQRQFLEEFFSLLFPKRAEWNLGPALWYTMRDHHQPTAGDGWHRLGLRYTNPDDTDAGAKPGWESFTTRSRAADRVPLPVAR